LLLPTVIAAKNDWHISINNASIPRGSSCAAVVTGINDHVVGTVQWDAGSDPGFDWWYSYDSTNWYSAPHGWSSPVVTFNFYANDHGNSWGSYFEIKATGTPPLPYEYYCLI